MAGVIAQQGEVNRALNLWQQSLDIYERIGDIQYQSATLHQIAHMIAQQGEVNRALNLWQQSLELKERINDIRSKAVTLSSMASVIFDKGDVDRALNLWQQSLEIKERFGDIRGKAITLAEMAYAAGETGDKARQFDLNLQAVQALGQVRAYIDLFTVLGNLAITTEVNSLSYLAQTFWLSLRIQVPLAEAIATSKVLYERVPQGDELESLLAAFALFISNQRGQGHPRSSSFSS